MERSHRIAPFFIRALRITQRRGGLRDDPAPSRTFPSVSTLSVTGPPRGCAWCGGSPSGSRHGRGRRCVLRFPLLSWVDHSFLYSSARNAQVRPSLVYFSYRQTFLSVVVLFSIYGEFILGENGENVEEKSRHTCQDAYKKRMRRNKYACILESVCALYALRKKQRENVPIPERPAIREANYMQTTILLCEISYHI